MIAALLVLAVGVADLLPARTRTSARLAFGGAWAALLAVGGVFGLGVHGGVAVALGVVAVVWAAVPRRDDATIVLTLALVAIVLAALAFEPALGSTPGPLESAWDRLGGPRPPLAFVVGALGVGLVMCRSVNEACRAVLRLARERGTEAQDGSRSPGAQDTRSEPTAWRVDVGRRTVARVVPDGPALEAAATPPALPEGTRLRGGRLIGPLERILIVAILVGGTPELLVALVAAKGIVRFPEISADRTNGSKAEEFLVGSLVSWALAAAGGLLLIALPNS